jgi:hypothetical protein
MPFFNFFQQAATWKFYANYSEGCYPTPVSVLVSTSTYVYFCTYVHMYKCTYVHMCPFDAKIGGVFSFKRTINRWQDWVGIVRARLWITFYFSEIGLLGAFVLI